MLQVDFFFLYLIIGLLMFFLIDIHLNSIFR